MKPHARRRLALRRVYYDLLNTICQLEQELEAYDAMVEELLLTQKRMCQARARMLRWAKRYRKSVLASMQRRLREVHDA